MKLIPFFYSIEQDASSEAEDSESKSNSSAFSPWNSTSDHRSIEKVANDNIMQGKLVIRPLKFS